MLGVCLEISVCFVRQGDNALPALHIQLKEIIRKMSTESVMLNTMPTCFSSIFRLNIIRKPATLVHQLIIVSRSVTVNKCFRMTWCSAPRQNWQGNIIPIVFRSSKVSELYMVLI